MKAATLIALLWTSAVAVTALPVTDSISSVIRRDGAVDPDADQMILKERDGAIGVDGDAMILKRDGAVGADADQMIL
ncbi:hypothetical protein F5Y16DRAFT_400641 [Xylariaceae sp. FL0255]|nr:hypothetical protein F5Y16DRAFT_400641 [Xylariaceae sp. FL0255]